MKLEHTNANYHVWWIELFVCKTTISAVSWNMLLKRQNNCLIFVAWICSFGTEMTHFCTVIRVNCWFFKYASTWHVIIFWKNELISYLKFKFNRKKLSIWIFFFFFLNLLTKVIKILEKLFFKRYGFNENLNN